MGMLIRRHRDKAGGEPLTMPNGSASKAEWVAWARSQGATDEDFDGLKRDDLREKYGTPQTPPPPAIFDPAGLDVAEILAYVAGLDQADTEARDAEIARVLQAERDGGNRDDVIAALTPPPAE